MSQINNIKLPFLEYDISQTNTTEYDEIFLTELIEKQIKESTARSDFTNSNLTLGFLIFVATFVAWVFKVLKGLDSRTDERVSLQTTPMKKDIKDNKRDIVDIKSTQNIDIKQLSGELGLLTKEVFKLSGIMQEKNRTDK